jgi:hypothetical protein
MTGNIILAVCSLLPLASVPSHHAGHTLNLVSRLFLHVFIGIFALFRTCHDHVFHLLQLAEIILKCTVIDSIVMKALPRWVILDSI